MIGKKVKVFWPVDESWYTGIVQEYDPNTGEHCLRYADGDIEWVKIGDLSSQQQHSTPSPTKPRESPSQGEPTRQTDISMSPLSSVNGHNRIAGSTTGSTLDDMRTSTGSSQQQLNNETDDDATSANLLLPPLKIPSSKSASPYPYVPPPPPPMYAGTGNTMIPPQQQHFMAYHPHYGGAAGGPPPPQMMIVGGHLPPPPHYGMMPPHMYDPNGGGGMDPTMMMMNGPGGEMMMMMDYPPMSYAPPPPPPSNTTVSTDLQHHHQIQHHQMNDANSAAGGNNRSRKSGPKPWTREEDNLLLTLVQTMQWPMKWTVVAQTLQDRTGKQCRERYVNHLNPRLKSSDWAPIEDATIFHLYNTIGSHWAKMSKIIPGRTDNGIKNRFHNIRRQYEREDTHRLRLSNVSEYVHEVRHDRLRNFPDHLSGKTLALWDMKCGIGIMAAQSIINGSSSCNAVSGLTASINRSIANSNSSNNSKKSSSDNTDASDVGKASGTPLCQNHRFGPFREVVVAAKLKNKSTEDGKDDNDDNDETKQFLDGSEVCIRCGLIVPSIHTGNEICTKTGWCISCVFVPPSICSNLLRETLNLRRCVDVGTKVVSHNKVKPATNTAMESDASQENTTTKDEVQELRSIIESFEEFFHPTNEEDEWKYPTSSSDVNDRNNDTNDDDLGEIEPVPFEASMPLSTGVTGSNDTYL